MKLVVDAESSQRGFLLAGESEFIKRFDQSIPKIETEIGELKNLVADNSEQSKNIFHLDQLINDRIKTFYLLLNSVSKSKKFGKSELIILKQGKRQMDEVRTSVIKIVG